MCRLKRERMDTRPLRWPPTFSCVCSSFVFVDFIAKIRQLEREKGELYARVDSEGTTCVVFVMPACYVSLPLHSAAPLFGRCLFQDNVMHCMRVDNEGPDRRVFVMPTSVTPGTFYYHLVSLKHNTQRLNRRNRGLASRVRASEEAMHTEACIK